METKKLYRSFKNRMIAGVCGGLGDYFSVDATLFRVGFILLSIVTACFPVVFVYVACALVIPLEPAAPSDTVIDITNSEE